MPGVGCPVRRRARRGGRTPRCRCYLFLGGLSAPRRSSGRRGSSPGGGGWRSRRFSPPLVGAGVGGAADRRPAPADAVRAHAAGVQADVTAVGGLLHSVAVQFADVLTTRAARAAVVPGGAGAAAGP